MLIEAAKGGHTSVVCYLLDYPNNLLSAPPPESTQLTPPSHDLNRVWVFMCIFWFLLCFIFSYAKTISFNLKTDIVFNRFVDDLVNYDQQLLLLKGIIFSWVSFNDFCFQRKFIVGKFCLGVIFFNFFTVCCFFNHTMPILLKCLKVGYFVKYFS